MTRKYVLKVCVQSVNKINISMFLTLLLNEIHVMCQWELI